MIQNLKLNKLLKNKFKVGDTVYILSSPNEFNKSYHGYLIDCGKIIKIWEYPKDYNDRFEIQLESGTVIHYLGCFMEKDFNRLKESFLETSYSAFDLFIEEAINFYLDCEIALSSQRSRELEIKEQTLLNVEKDIVAHTVENNTDKLKYLNELKNELTTKIQKLKQQLKRCQKN